MPIDPAILEQVIQRYKRNEFQYQIKHYLISKGVEEDDISIYLKQGEEMSSTFVIKLPKIYWLIIGLAILCCFLFIIPLAIFHKSPLLFAISGGLLLVYFLSNLHHN